MFKGQDLSGLKFNHLILLEIDHINNKDRHAYYKCRCDCGNMIIVNGYRVKYGKKKSCGCGNYIDLTGYKSGKLTVVEVTNNGKHGGKYWLCKCDCGKYKKVRSSELQAKTIRSCGCLRKENGSWNNKNYQDISGSYWRSLKSGAISRKIPFEINIKDIWKLFQQQDGLCALSGIKLTHKKYCYKENGKDIWDNGTASLDRIDSNKGYVKNNIQWVHRTINYMKRNLSEDEFINLCKKVVNHIGV
jgi:hypothetical protein